MGVRVAIGKYISLEEARKAGKLDRFIKEHPSNGSESLFDRLLETMAGKVLKKKSRNAKK